MEGGKFQLETFLMSKPAGLRGVKTVRVEEAPPAPVAGSMTREVNLPLNLGNKTSPVRECDILLLNSRGTIPSLE